MESGPYRVELELFSGPLDLLLYLVRRNEVDVIDLPVSRIAAQFEEMLRVIELVDLDAVGDFVVMASTLVEVKSRMVLPRPEETEATEEPIEEDPRSELIQRLLEYKQFKDAALMLEERSAEWQERYPRLSDERPRSEKDPAADRIKEVELWDLVSALGRVLRSQQVEEETSIKYDDTPVAVYVDQIGAKVRSEGPVLFSSLFDQERLRSRIVGLFLAVLELLRHHRFRAEQKEPYGDILILPPLEESQPGSAPESGQGE